MNQYRCENNCTKINCYFHPSKEEWRRSMNGGNDNSPIPISLFTIRFGCASHSDFKSERDKVLDEGIIGINGEPYRIEGEPCGLCDGTGKAQKLSGFSPDEDCPLCDGTGLHIKWVKVQELRQKAGE
jgi:DnaJ-class molecular chaperone